MEEGLLLLQAAVREKLVVAAISGAVMVLAPLFIPVNYMTGGSWSHTVGSLFMMVQCSGVIGVHDGSMFVEFIDNPYPLIRLVIYPESKVYTNSLFSDYKLCLY